jgi:hypothetical protein
VDVPQRFCEIPKLIFSLPLSEQKFKEHAQKIGTLCGGCNADRKIRIVRLCHLSIVNQQSKKGQPQTQTMNFFKRQQPQTPVMTEPKHQTGSVIPLTKIFTDSDGDHWFEYSNPLTMPSKRAIAAEVATRFAEMNMTKEQLKTMVEAMKKSANSGNIVEMFHLLAEIEWRLEFIGEQNTMIELAACYYVLDGEDETEFNDVFKMRRIEKLNNNPVVRDFFVQRALMSTIKFSELSSNDIQDYLNLSAQENARFYRILQALKSGNTLTTSISPTKSFAKTKSPK